MSNAESGGPFRRRGFIIAAIVVGAILLLGVIAIVASLLTNRDDDEPGPTSAPTTSSSTDPADADLSICGLEDFEETSSLDGPPSNEWELVGTIAAPVDTRGAGPGVIDANGFRSCYARTAEGALFAAVGYVAVGSDARNVPRLYELLAAGPVRDELEASPAPGDASATRLQVAGFKINSYTADEATVDVAWQVTSEGSALVSLPTVLTWEDGDWKVVIGENGPPFAPSPLENLGGYTPWAGV
ncbi:hypothetical protein [Microbacterium sp. A1-JK]|uniref:hypothetical protein n=1 Tax=Microbacterium sp. A1-JK TaxID=3177516 RepID=UPI003886E2E7